MEENTTPPVQQEKPWVGYLILAIVLVLLFQMFSYCTKHDDSVANEKEAFKSSSGIGYRFLKKNSSYGKYDTPWKNYLYRSYAYEITNFDKNNPQCWQDLYDLGESVSTKTDKNSKLMTTMVYFFLPSDSLRLQDEDNWNMTWDESQDSLWIGNYLWLSGNGHKELIKGVNYR